MASTGACRCARTCARTGSREYRVRLRPPGSQPIAVRLPGAARQIFAPTRIRTAPDNPLSRSVEAALLRWQARDAEVVLSADGEEPQLARRNRVQFGSSASVDAQAARSNRKHCRMKSPRPSSAGKTVQPAQHRDRPQPAGGLPRARGADPSSWRPRRRTLTDARAQERAGLRRPGAAQDCGRLRTTRVRAPALLVIRHVRPKLARREVPGHLPAPTPRSRSADRARLCQARGSRRT